MSKLHDSEFDQFAQTYKSDLDETIPPMFTEGDYFALYKIQYLKSRLTGREPATVLDFGCGVGLSLSILHDYFPAADLYGYDVSEKSIDQARERLGIAHLTSNLDELPAASFDVILAANVFHHIPVSERVGAFARCRRLLRSGGRMYLFEHNPLNPLTRIIFERCPFDRDAEMLRKHEAIELVKAAGFDVVRSDYTLFFPKQVAFLRPVEKMLGRVPLGAQYCVEMTYSN